MEIYIPTWAQKTCISTWIKQTIWKSVNNWIFFIDNKEILVLFPSDPQFTVNCIDIGHGHLWGVKMLFILHMSEQLVATK